MKKLFLTALLSIVLCGCNNVKYSSSNIILPLFSTDSTSQNKIWVGTFQLVFNDIKNNVLKQDVYFEREEPTTELKGLNAQEFDSSMLNDSSYYISHGKTTYEAKEEIKKNIKLKFNETSDIIEKLDWTPSFGKYYAYAMLKKQFEFLDEFDILEPSGFNDSADKYKYFGIKPSSDNKIRENVNVLFYNNENEYAVSLNTQSGDMVYLYRSDRNRSLKELYQSMLDNERRYNKDRSFKDTDTLKIPNIKFNKMREYEELCKKKIKGTELFFSKAIETLEFELDSKGGKVKSEAVLMTDNSSVVMEEKENPRNFDFDKTFNLFLIDSGKQDPYMALRIYDLKEFTK